MNARDAILGALSGPADADMAAEAAALLVAPERPEVDPAHRLEQFLACLSLPSVSATHDRIGSMADLPSAIAAYLHGHDLSPELYLPPDPQLAGCDWSGFHIDTDVAPDQPAALAIARCGIAETGSLVFETSPAAPMLPNFLTLHHIVLLRQDAIVAHLEDAILAGQQPRAHYWVTGVSGTTDIEGSYVRGAHGPRYLHVILLGEAR